MNFVSQASSNAHWMPTVHLVFYALKASKMEVRSCHLCSNWEWHPVWTRGKAELFTGAYKTLNALRPSQPPCFPADSQSVHAPVYNLSREHSHPSDQAGSCLRTLPRRFLLPGIYLANFLIAFKSLLPSHHDSEASSDYPIQPWDMVPALPPTQFQCPLSTLFFLSVALVAFQHLL